MGGLRAKLCDFFYYAATASYVLFRRIHDIQQHMDATRDITIELYED